MRALLSVYDKDGLVELAQGLADLGWELVASGNTAAALAEAGIAHHRGGRGHRLARDARRAGQDPAPEDPRRHPGRPRRSPSTWPTSTTNGIEAIDLVVCNLYPFSSDPSIELIDIGGPSMVRGRGQEPRPRGRRDVPAGLRRGARRARSDGLAVATRRAAALARAAFAHTAAYDAAIVAWLDAGGAPSRAGAIAARPTTSVAALRRCT